MQLPQQVEEECCKSKMNGYFFKVSDKKWQLDKSICVFPVEVVKNLSPDFQFGYINTLAYFAKNFSAGYVKTVNVVFSKFFSTGKFEVIDDESVLRFKARLNEKEIYCLCYMKSFLQKWLSFNYPGVHSSSVEIFNKIRIERGRVGEAIKRRDPNHGPFTEEELNMIVVRTNQLLTDKKIDLALFCFLQLLIHTGRRPLQLTSLKNIDLKKNEHVAVIKIPRVKQKLSFRESFSENIIGDKLYDLLVTLKKQTVEILKVKFETVLDNSIIEMLPIFIDQKTVDSCKSISELKSNLESDFLHAKNGHLKDQINVMAKENHLVSERTGTVINLNPRRFRYTLGTNLAKNGASISVIAKALDHSTISSAGIYIKNTADNVENIDAHMNRFLEPLSKVFMGLEIESNSKRFINSMRDAFGIKDEVPNEIKCFSCKQFNPWRGKIND